MYDASSRARAPGFYRHAAGVYMIKFRKLALALTLLGAFADVPALAQQAVPDTAQAAPEVGTAYKDKAGWVAKKYMVAAANPLAVGAGYQMLKKGGTAIDAAIATQLVL